MKISRRRFVQSAVGAATVLAAPAAPAQNDSTILKKAIPSSGELVPVIGVGTNRFGVGDDAELRAPLKAALHMFHELGGTVIDTAPQYRSSEIVLGELIAELGINSDLFMASKVDVETRDDVVARMQRTLSRLNRNKLDLMQVHNFIGWQQAIPVMQEWKQEGKVRYIGITSSDQRQYELMEKVMTQYELDFVQVNYSLAHQRSSDNRILPLAEDRGIAVLVNRPFGGGNIFKTLLRTPVPEWASDLGVSSWGQFLLKYALSHPSVTCAIPGMTKEHHVVDNMRAALPPMPDASMRHKMELFFDNIDA